MMSDWVLVVQRNPWIPRRYKHLFITIIRFGDRKTGENIFPSVESLTAECGVNRQVIQRGVKWLRMHKLITLVAEGGGRTSSGVYKGRTNRYAFTDENRRALAAFRPEQKEPTRGKGIAARSLVVPMDADGNLELERIAPSKQAAFLEKLAKLNERNPVRRYSVEGELFRASTRYEGTQQPGTLVPFNRVPSYSQSVQAVPTPPDPAGLSAPTDHTDKAASTAGQHPVHAVENSAGLRPTDQADVPRTKASRIHQLTLFGRALMLASEETRPSDLAELSLYLGWLGRPLNIDVDGAKHVAETVWRSFAVMPRELGGAVSTSEAPSDQRRIRGGSVTSPATGDDAAFSRAASLAAELLAAEHAAAPTSESELRMKLQQAMPGVDETTLAGASSKAWLRRPGGPLFAPPAR